MKPSAVSSSDRRATVAAAAQSAAARRGTVARQQQRMSGMPGTLLGAPATGPSGKRASLRRGTRSGADVSAVLDTLWAASNPQAEPAPGFTFHAPVPPPAPHPAAAAVPPAPIDSTNGFSGSAPPAHPSPGQRQHSAPSRRRGTRGKGRASDASPTPPPDAAAYAQILQSQLGAGDSSTTGDGGEGSDAFQYEPPTAPLPVAPDTAAAVAAATAAAAAASSGVALPPGASAASAGAYYSTAPHRTALSAYAAPMSARDRLKAKPSLPAALPLPTGLISGNGGDTKGDAADADDGPVVPRAGALHEGLGLAALAAAAAGVTHVPGAASFPPIRTTERDEVRQLSDALDYFVRRLDMQQALRRDHQIAARSTALVPADSSGNSSGSGSTALTPAPSSAASELDELLRVAREEQQLYDLFLSEIIGQVNVTCRERGTLLGRIRNQYRAMFKRIPQHAAVLQKQLQAQRALTSQLTAELAVLRDKHFAQSVELRTYTIKARDTQQQLDTCRTELSQSEHQYQAARQLFDALQQQWDTQRASLQAQVDLLREHKADSDVLLSVAGDALQSLPKDTLEALLKASSGGGADLNAAPTASPRAAQHPKKVVHSSTVKEIEGVRDPKPTVPADALAVVPAASAAASSESSSAAASLAVPPAPSTTTPKGTGTGGAASTSTPAISPTASLMSLGMLSGSAVPASQQPHLRHGPDGVTPMHAAAHAAAEKAVAFLHGQSSSVAATPAATTTTGTAGATAASPTAAGTSDAAAVAPQAGQQQPAQAAAHPKLLRERTFEPRGTQIGIGVIDPLAAASVQSPISAAGTSNAHHTARAADVSDPEDDDTDATNGAKPKPSVATAHSAQSSPAHIKSTKGRVLRQNLRRGTDPVTPPVAGGPASVHTPGSTLPLPAGAVDANGSPLPRASAGAGDHLSVGTAGADGQQPRGRGNSNRTIPPSPSIHSVVVGTDGVKANRKPGLPDPATPTDGTDPATGLPRAASLDVTRRGAASAAARAAAAGSAGGSALSSTSVSMDLGTSSMSAGVSLGGGGGGGGGSDSRWHELTGTTSAQQSAHKQQLLGLMADELSHGAKQTKHNKPKRHGHGHGHGADATAPATASAAGDASGGGATAVSPRRETATSGTQTTRIGISSEREQRARRRLSDRLKRWVERENNAFDRWRKSDERARTRSASAMSLRTPVSGPTPVSGSGGGGGSGGKPPTDADLTRTLATAALAERREARASLRDDWAIWKGSALRRKIVDTRIAAIAKRKNTGMFNFTDGGSASTSTAPPTGTPSAATSTAPASAREPGPVPVPGEDLLDSDSEEEDADMFDDPEADRLVLEVTAPDPETLFDPLRELPPDDSDLDAEQRRIDRLGHVSDEALAAAAATVAAASAHGLKPPTQGDDGSDEDDDNSRRPKQRKAGSRPSSGRRSGVRPKSGARRGAAVAASIHAGPTSAGGAGLSSHATVMMTVASQVGGGGAGGSGATASGTSAGAGHHHQILIPQPPEAAAKQQQRAGRRGSLDGAATPMDGKGEGGGGGGDSTLSSTSASDGVTTTVDRLGGAHTHTISSSKKRTAKHRSTLSLVAGAGTGGTASSARASSHRRGSTTLTASGSTDSLRQRRGGGGGGGEGGDGEGDGDDDGTSTVGGGDDPEREAARRRVGLPDPNASAPAAQSRERVLEKLVTSLLKQNETLSSYVYGRYKDSVRAVLDTNAQQARDLRVPGLSASGSNRALAAAAAAGTGAAGTTGGRGAPADPIAAAVRAQLNNNAAAAASAPSSGGSSGSGRGGDGARPIAPEDDLYERVNEYMAVTKLRLEADTRREIERERMLRAHGLLPPSTPGEDGRPPLSHAPSHSQSLPHADADTLASAYSAEPERKFDDLKGDAQPNTTATVSSALGAAASLATSTAAAAAGAGGPAPSDDYALRSLAYNSRFLDLVRRMAANSATAAANSHVLDDGSDAGGGVRASRAGGFGRHSRSSYIAHKHSAVLSGTVARVMGAGAGAPEAAAVAAAARTGKGGVAAGLAGGLGLGSTNPLANSLPRLQLYIRKVYDAKTLSDNHLRQESQPELPLPEYVLDLQRKTFGLPQLIEHKTWQLIVAVAAHRDSSTEVDLFAQFLEESRPKSELVLFLRTRAVVYGITVGVRFPGHLNPTFHPQPPNGGLAGTRHNNNSNAGDDDESGASGTAAPANTTGAPFAATATAALVPSADEYICTDRARAVIATIFPDAPALGPGAAGAQAAKSSSAVAHALLEQVDAHARLWTSLAHPPTPAQLAHMVSSAGRTSTTKGSVAPHCLRLATFLELMLAQYRHIDLQMRHHKWARAVFASVDRNHDGWIDFDAFTSLMSTAQPQHSARELSHLFSNVLIQQQNRATASGATPLPASTKQISFRSWKLLSRQLLDSGVVFPAIAAVGAGAPQSKASATLQLVARHWSAFRAFFEQWVAHLKQSGDSRDAQCAHTAKHIRQLLDRELAAAMARAGTSADTSAAAVSAAAAMGLPSVAVSAGRAVTLYRGLLSLLMAHQASHQLVRVTDAYPVQSLGIELDQLERTAMERDRLLGAAATTGGRAGPLGAPAAGGAGTEPAPQMLEAVTSAELASALHVREGRSGGGGPQSTRNAFTTAPVPHVQGLAAAAAAAAALSGVQTSRPASGEPTADAGVFPKLRGNLTAR